MLSGLSDPITVATSVSGSVYDSADAASLLATAPDVQLAGFGAGGTPSFIGQVFAFANPSGNLATGPFNDSSTTSQVGIQATLSFDAAQLGAGSAPLVVWLDTAASPPVWTNAGVTVLSSDLSAGTITALLPHLSTYTVVAAADELVAGDTLSFGPSPVAQPGTLGSGQAVAVTLSAGDAAGQPLADASVYLSLGAGAAGAATVSGTALSSSPQAFTTGGAGQLTIEYTAGSGSGVTDTITAASAAGSSAAVLATDSYQHPTSAGTGSAPSGGGSTQPAWGGSGGIGPGGSIPPYVSGLSPTSGPPGTELTITGSNFTGANIVFFNGTPGTNLVVDSDGELTVDAPVGLTGTVDVTVQNGHGTSAVLANTVFTFTGGTLNVSSAVTAAGGTLVTADGAFSMTIPVGDLAGTGRLSLMEATAAPGGLPSGFVAASPIFILNGAALASPAEAVIAYPASVLNGRLPQRLGVYTQNAAGAWVFLPTRLGGGDSVSVAIAGPGTLVLLAATATFSDIPAAFWARGDIDTLLAAGIVAGFPDGSFQPEGAVTRAEFVKMLDLALGLRPGAGTAGFGDVAAGDWFAPYVAAAVQAGLVQGLTPASFAPNQTVTREQMAVLLARAFKLTGGAQLSFTDASLIDPYARAAVQAAVAAGNLSGFPDGTFQPQGATTRAQAAAALAWALQAEATAP